MAWRSWFRASGLAGLAATACVSGGDCPSHLVSLDAGATGFSSVGEWRTDSVCTRYCTSEYTVCQFVKQNTIVCQKSCL